MDKNKSNACNIRTLTEKKIIYQLLKIIHLPKVYFITIAAFVSANYLMEEFGSMAWECVRIALCWHTGLWIPCVNTKQIMSIIWGCNDDA